MQIALYNYIIHISTISGTFSLDALLALAGGAVLTGNGSFSGSTTVGVWGTCGICDF